VRASRTTTAAAWTTWIAWAGVVLVVALLTSCSGDDTRDSSATPGSGASSATSTGPSAAEKLTQQLLGTTSDDPAIGSASGTVEINGQPSQLVADVVEVRAGAQTTLLRWRLKSASGSAARALGFWLSEPPLFDSRGITILDRPGNHALSPFTYNKDDHDCVCSRLPGSVDGDGEPMYALYPPLDASTSTVDITLPGFSTITGVPVTRS
jgi:hypothetical protein